MLHVYIVRLLRDDRAARLISTSHICHSPHYTYIIMENIVSFFTYFASLVCPEYFILNKLLRLFLSLEGRLAGCQTNKSVLTS